MREVRVLVRLDGTVNKAWLPPGQTTFPAVKSVLKNRKSDSVCNTDLSFNHSTLELYHLMNSCAGPDTSGGERYKMTSPLF